MVAMKLALQDFQPNLATEEYFYFNILERIPLEEIRTSEQRTYTQSMKQGKAVDQTITL